LRRKIEKEYEGRKERMRDIYIYIERERERERERSKRMLREEKEKKISMRHYVVSFLRSAL